MQLRMQRWIVHTSRLTLKRQQIAERVLVGLGWHLLREEVCQLPVEVRQLPMEGSQVNSQQLEANQWWNSQ